MDTLPDYLREGLDIVFVGLSPSVLSARAGHYFANPRNRFWPAVNAAGLLPEPLTAQQDHRMLESGMGFTDIVKRPTRGVGELTTEEFRAGAPVLREKLLRYRPRIVCFHGLTLYRHYLRYAEGEDPRDVALGLQPHPIGASRAFVVPNPSPANAAFRLEDLVGWYRRLKELRDALRAGAPSTAAPPPR